MKRTAPPTILAGGSGNRRITANAARDLPHPDSPTIATVSPARDLQRQAVDRRQHAAPREQRDLESVDREDRGALWNGVRGHVSDPAVSD